MYGLSSSQYQRMLRLQYEIEEMKIANKTLELELMSFETKLDADCLDGLSVDELQTLELNLVKHSEVICTHVQKKKSEYAAQTSSTSAETVKEEENKKEDAAAPRGRTTRRKNRRKN